MRKQDFAKEHWSIKSSIPIGPITCHPDMDVDKNRCLKTSSFIINCPRTVRLLQWCRRVCRVENVFLNQHATEMSTMSSMLVFISRLCITSY